MKELLISIFTVVGLCLILGLLYACIFNSGTNGSLVLIENSGTYKIYYDKETKVEYIKTSSRSGLTARIDKDGKPILYNGE